MAMEVFKKSFLSTRGAREGLFLRIKEGAFRGIGEYSPLSGIHEQNIDDALKIVNNFNGAKEVSKLDTSLVGLQNYFKPIPYPLSWLLSQVHFSNRCMSSIHGQVPLCGLIESTDPQNVENEARAYRAEGYRTVKLKVGRSCLKDDLVRLDRLLKIFASVRLDANQGLSLANALALIKDRSIDYFEEPTCDLHQAQALRALAPLAVDESFGPFKKLALCKDRADVLVLKPSRFHSLYEVIAIAEEAKTLGLKVVLSHCFESEVSTAIFAFLAHKLELLDPQGILASDTFADSSKGEIDLLDAQKTLEKYL